MRAIGATCNVRHRPGPPIAHPDREREHERFGCVNQQDLSTYRRCRAEPAVGYPPGSGRQLLHPTTGPAQRWHPRRCAPPTAPRPGRPSNGQPGQRFPVHTAGGVGREHVRRRGRHPIRDCSIRGGGTAPAAHRHGGPAVGAARGRRTSSAGWPAATSATPHRFAPCRPAGRVHTPGCVAPRL